MFDVIQGMEFHDKLQRLARSRGWSAERLASELGTVSKSTVSNWFRGKHRPDVRDLGSLCRIFDVSPEYFVFDEIEEPKRFVWSPDQMALIEAANLFELHPKRAAKILAKAMSTGLHKNVPEERQSPTIATQDTSEARKQRNETKGKPKGTEKGKPKRRLKRGGKGGEVPGQ